MTGQRYIGTNLHNSIDRELLASLEIEILGLTLKDGASQRCSHVGTGMHGGRILIRGEVPAEQLGGGVGVFDLNDEDLTLLEKYLAEYGTLFAADMSDIGPGQFVKFAPLSTRPYKQIYAY